MKRHTEEQAAEDLAREKEAAARYQQNMDRIRAETAQANQQIADTNKLLSDLQHELDTLRSQRESESNHEFDLTKQLEVARIAQRNAELETQRMVDMIAARADRSSLTAMPPPPPPSKE
jgi:chromosome segregation ATPase